MSAGLPGFAALDIGWRWVVLTWGRGQPLLASPDWLARARAMLRLAPDGPSELPYCGGLIGWVGYEAGATVESMPAPRSPPLTPSVCLWRTEGALILDRRACRWIITGEAGFQSEARALLDAAVEPPPLAPPPPSDWAGRPREEIAAAYKQGVARVLDAIRAGDVYQVNLAWEEQGLAAVDPVLAWRRLRANNPARRGALLMREDLAVLSNSPELYLRVRRRGDRLIARSTPIKGTAGTLDEEARQALEDSEKERAELTMIVDLVRNDLSRVAARRGVRPHPRSTVRCGDLWHAEQQVVARLRRGADALDALAASFPPGSVTGAPKVEAMRVIRRLEDRPRGIYTGAIGLLADGGEAHFNVAIRTAILQGGTARFHVGAGLVADSIPEREWAETLAKGRALAAAVEAR